MDANPPVKGIRWLRDGRPISNHFNHTIPETHLSDAGLYACQADNGVASPVAQLAAIATSAVEAQLNVQVLYAPRVHIKPTKPMPLNLNEPFGLNCTAEAWPPVTELVWTKSDDPTFRRVSQIAPMAISGSMSSLNPPLASSFLEFSGAQANDMANYTCTAFNRLDPSPTSTSSASSHAPMMRSQAVHDRHASASILVLVRHPPGKAEISAGNNGQTELGARTNIECRARPPGFPEPQYRFWKYGSPGTPRKELPSTKSIHGPVYTIYSAKADDEARYGCMATNEFGISDEVDTELVVNEPPVIINDNTVSMSMMRQDEDERMPGDHPYSITVRASGKPEPKVTWWHRSPIDGRRMDLSSAEAKQRVRIDTIVNAESIGAGRKRYNVFATLTFLRPLEVDDRGLYTVEFDNGLTRSASKDFRLHIEHKPVPAVHRSHPVFAGGRSSTLASSLYGQQQSHQQQQQQPHHSALPSVVKMKAGFEPGDSVNLTCRVSAHPRPEFTWYTHEGGVIGTSSRYAIDVSNPIDDIWESTLSFAHASVNDFGEYMCTAANMDRRTSMMGKEIQILISLEHRSPPDTPTQIEPIDSTQDSVTLQWLPGFDGGFSHNDFIVQFALDDGSNEPLSKRFGQSADTMYALDSSAASSSSQTADLSPSAADNSNYPKLYDCGSMNPCQINQLMAKQAYVFRVRARNKLGSSAFSEEVRAMTRANMSHVPRISDASFDSARNVLYFRVDPNSDYLLNQLQARIEVRAPPVAQMHGFNSDNSINGTSGNSLASVSNIVDQSDASEWRLNSIVPIRHERAEAYLNMAPGSEQLRITLCSRSNETLCGSEYIVSLRSAASSFLHDQRGLSLSIMLSTLSLIVVLGALATTMHSCCLSRKAKKVASLGRSTGANSDSASGANEHKKNSNGPANGCGGSGSGSTVSTNSTSANGVGSNGLHSMDSVLTGGASLAANGVASDHSSDHSRQAKMDSLLPPNYNHYADRASLMFEQSKAALGSPFGLPQSTAQPPRASPMLPNGAFTYGHLPALDTTTQHQLDAQQLMFDAGNPMDPISQMMQAEHQWQQHQQQLNSGDYGTTMAQVVVDDSAAAAVDPTYGTTGIPSAQQVSSQAASVAQQSAVYDNTANNSQQQYRSYLSSPYGSSSATSQQQQQANAQYQQYQQEIAAAQQQMYGTLTRNSGTYSHQQQQDNNNNQSDNQQQDPHYMTTNGLIAPPPLPPPSMGQPQESDYGVVGGSRSGRLIREIIV